MLFLIVCLLMMSVFTPRMLPRIHSVWLRIYRFEFCRWLKYYRDVISLLCSNFLIINYLPWILAYNKSVTSPVFDLLEGSNSAALLESVTVTWDIEILLQGRKLVHKLSIFWNELPPFNVFFSDKGDNFWQVSVGLVFSLGIFDIFVAVTRPNIFSVNSDFFWKNTGSNY